MPPNKYPRFDAVAVNQCGQVQYSFVCPAPACEQSGKAALTSFIGSNVWRCKSATCSAAKKSYKMTVANANDNLRVIANANFVEDQRQRDFWYAAPVCYVCCSCLLTLGPLHRCLLLSIPSCSLGALLPQCVVASVRCCLSPIVLFLVCRYLVVLPSDGSAVTQRLGRKLSADTVQTTATPGKVQATLQLHADTVQTPAAPARVQADLKLDADNVQTPAASVRVQENSDRLKRMQARKTGVKNRREPVPSTPPQVTTPT